MGLSLIIGKLPTGDRLHPTAAAVAGLCPGGDPGGVAVTAVAENVIQVGLGQAKVPSLQFFGGEVGRNVCHDSGTGGGPVL